MKHLILAVITAVSLNALAEDMAVPKTTEIPEPATTAGAITQPTAKQAKAAHKHMNKKRGKKAHHKKKKQH